MQADYDIYGEKFFNYTVIEEVNAEVRYDREQFWMDFYNAQQPLYNIFPFAGTAKGRKHFEETKEKMSKAAKGRMITKEQREKLSKANKGRRMPRETVLKLSETLKQVAARGEESASSKLTEEEALEIIQKIADGVPQKDVAKHYGISTSTVSHLWNGTTWSHLPRDNSLLKPRSPLTAEEVEDIYRRCHAGESGVSVAKEYGVSHSVVYQIKNGNSWKKVTERLRKESAVC